MDNSKEKDLDFFNRLFFAIDQHNPTFWAGKLGVAQSTISGRWKKGSYPSSKNIVKICEYTGISANWLLLGHGPRFINDNDINVENLEAVEIAKIRKQTNEEVFTLRNQLEELKSKIEVEKHLKWLKKNFPSFDEENLSWARF